MTSPFIIPLSRPAGEPAGAPTGLRLLIPIRSAAAGAGTLAAAPATGQDARIIAAAAVAAAPEHVLELVGLAREKPEDTVPPPADAALYREAVSQLAAARTEPGQPGEISAAVRAAAQAAGAAPAIVSSLSGRLSAGQARAARRWALHQLDAALLERIARAALKAQGLALLASDAAGIEKRVTTLENDSKALVARVKKLEGRKRRR